MTIGEKIKQIRHEKDLTQTELAFKMGFNTKGAVSKIEAAGDEITLKNIQKAAKALGVHPNILMGWDSNSDNLVTEYLKKPEYNDFFRFICEKVPSESASAIFSALKATTLSILSVK